MQELRASTGAESVYGVLSPKWDIYILPTLANTQGRGGTKTVRARRWGILEKHGVFWKQQAAALLTSRQS